MTPSTDTELDRPRKRVVKLEVIIPYEQKSWRVAAALQMCLDWVEDVRVISAHPLQAQEDKGEQV